MKRHLLYILLVVILAGCSSVVRITSSKMDKLELGMTKEQVVNILGKGYRISEKRIEEGLLIEVLSYRDLYNEDEFYLFQFKDDRLEKWYRELVPKYESPKK